MIAIKICSLLLEVALIVFFLLTGSAAALAVAAALLLLVLLALPANLYVRRKLEYGLESPVNLRKNAEGRGELLLKNPTFFPVLRVICVVEAENCLTGVKQKLHLGTSLMPKGRKELSFKLADVYCGRIKLRLEQIKLYDALGIIPVRLKCKEHKSTTIQPDTFDQQLRMELLMGSSDDSDSYSPYRPGSDVSETFQIREYVEGDSMRQIHWKLSGKLDRLIVKDPSLPVIRSVLVYWDRANKILSPEKMDAQAEVVVTLCRTLLDNSIVFTIGWNEPAEQRCILHSVGSMDDMVALMPRMLSVQGINQGMGGGQLLLESLGGQNYSRIIYICHEPSPEVDTLRQLSHVTLLSSFGGRGITFDEENYQDQLAELIL